MEAQGGQADLDALVLSYLVERGAAKAQAAQVRGSRRPPSCRLGRSGGLTAPGGWRSKKVPRPTSSGWNRSKPKMVADDDSYQRTWQGAGSVQAVNEKRGQRQMEEAHSHREAQYDAVAEASREAYWEEHPEGRRTSPKEKAQEGEGSERPDPTGTAYIQFIQDMRESVVSATPNSTTKKSSRSWVTCGRGPAEHDSQVRSCTKRIRRDTKDGNIPATARRFRGAP